MKTLFVGQKRIYLEHIDSTNKYLANHPSLSNLSEGITVVADYQSNGKGQRNNNWHSERGKNVMLSVLLRPKFLKTNNFFILNKGVTLAVLNTIEYFIDEKVYIKWPNDTIVGGKKIAGLLVELNWRSGVCHSAIIGLGLNVNQEQFEALPNAVSLKNLGCNGLELDKVIDVFCKNLEFQYLQIRRMDWEPILFAFNNSLYGRKKSITYFHNGIEKSGIIQRVNNDGKLIISTEGEEYSFSHGDIAISY